ncbi:hypothetical protein PASE110613_06705 [Paenibacillus sediminis]|uniref:TfoX N-terminal domain-containing protein n=1 Tax=Paenibacillus sediminis TaxID=664909 RepID=A0ABS4H1T4_9BACL|nr:hypothetical protein [Paenibacillus sediminis]
MWHKDHQYKRVKNLTRKLLYCKLKRAILFQSNRNFAIGIIMECEDGVLKLINAEHYVEINSVYTMLVSPQVYISVYHITGFALADDNLLSEIKNTIDHSTQRLSKTTQST